MELSQKITYLRKQKGWSQEQLATKLEVSRQAVYKWEAGISQPEIDKLKKIAKLFEVSFDELLDDEITVDIKEEDTLPPPASEEVAEKDNTVDINNEEEPKPKEKRSGKRALIIGLIVSIVATLVMTVAGVILLFRLVFPLEFGTENTGSTLTNGNNADVESSTDSSVANGGTTDSSKPSESQATYYTVTFDTDGGTPVESIRVKAGERISADIHTEYEGHELICWLSTDTYDEWDFANDKVTKDITLIALWADGEITVTLHKNDGSGEKVELITDENGFLTLGDIFADSGKALLGWSSEPNGEIEFEVGEEILLYYDMELYAIWEKQASQFEFEWTYPNGYSLVKYNGNKNVVEIPTYYHGYPVIAIGDGAFENSPSVKVIRIPSGVSQINELTFFGCIELEEIWIPDTVTQIQPIAFSYCESLQNIMVKGYNPSYYSINGVLYNEARTQLVAYPRGRHDKEYYVPNGTHIIGERSFFGNINIERVYLPNGVGVVRTAAFEGCINLTEIDLGDRIDYVDGRAFYGCESLREVTFEYNLYAIGKEAFYNCFALETVNILGDVGVISYRTFGNCYNLTVFTIGGAVTDGINEDAFEGCENFGGVTIG